MKEIYEKFIKSLETKEPGEEIIFKNQTAKIGKDNFKEINCIQSNRKIAFIDGGNAEIFGAANFSLQLIRIYYTIYQNNRRKANKRQDYYLLIKMADYDGLKYKIEFLNYKNKELHFNTFFNPFEKNLMEGDNRVAPQRIAQHYRKLLEIEIIFNILPLLNKEDIIIRDGDLVFEEAEEKNIFQKIKQEILLKKIIIAGLSKTSTVITNKGESAINAISAISKSGTWVYDTDIKYNGIRIFFIKLNKNSKYVFRLDVLEKQDSNTAISLLEENSTDITFPGYPYGLIESDKFARVSLNEVENIKAVFLAQNQEFLEESIKSQTAHDLINS